MTAIIINNIIFYGGLEGCVIPLCPRPGEKKHSKLRRKNKETMPCRRAGCPKRSGI